MQKVYSAAITPFTESGHIDIKSLERMLERNIKHGVDGFFFLGSMGEWTQMNDSQKETLVSESAKIINKRAEIFAGISGTSLNISLANMEKLSKYNVDAFVITIPAAPYSSINHVDFVLDIANRSDRPVYFYYLPGTSGRALNLSEFKEILKHPKVVGIKNSSGSMNTRKELLMLKQEENFKLLEGHEWAVDEALLLGCDGILVGMASLCSKIFKSIAAAIESGNTPKALSIQHDLVRIFWAVYGKDLSSIWAGQKYALQHLGIFSNHKTFIQTEKVLSDTRKKEIEDCMAKYRELID